MKLFVVLLVGAFAVLINGFSDIRVKRSDENDWQGLHKAAYNGNLQEMRDLLRRGTNVNVRGKDNWTPLHVAARYDKAEVARLLLANGANVNAEDKEKWIPIHVTAKHGSVNVAKILIQNGANVNAKDSLPNKRTPLFETACYGQVEVAKVLIANGADVNARDIGNWLPLFLAIQCHHALPDSRALGELARLFLQNGSDVHVVDNHWKRTPLFHSALFGQLSVVRALIEYGADVNVEDNDKSTPLFFACQNPDPQKSKVIAELLIAVGANVNAKSNSGSSPLLEAASRGHVDVVKILIDHRADVNEVDNVRGNYAIHLASEKGNIKIIEMLLDNGAHKNVRNKDGETAADIAKRLGNKAVQELFRQDIGRAVQRACQSYSADRILNGEVAADDELPWMAALGYFINERSFQIVFSCGGTIISNNFIMTAAHCVKNQRPVVVRMGKISLVDSDDDDTSTAIHRSIKNIMIHPGHSTLTKQNDIALIETKKLIPFSQYLRPACLQINLRDEPLNVKLIVSGWGITSPERKLN